MQVSDACIHETMPTSADVSRTLNLSHSFMAASIVFLIHNYSAKGQFQLFDHYLGDMLEDQSGKGWQ